MTLDQAIQDADRIILCFHGNVKDDYFNADISSVVAAKLTAQYPGKMHGDYIVRLRKLILGTRSSATDNEPDVECYYPS